MASTPKNGVKPHFIFVQNRIVKTVSLFRITVKKLTYTVRLKNKFCIYLSKYLFVIESGLKVISCQSARIESNPPPPNLEGTKNPGTYMVK